MDTPVDERMAAAGALGLRPLYGTDSARRGFLRLCALAPVGLPALARGAPDMNSLVAVGSLAAFGYSMVATFAPDLLPAGTVHVYYEAAAVIVTLILLGRLLEARARGLAERLRGGDRGPLGLVATGDPYAMDQPTQDAAARDPRWVPAISSATSASIGAISRDAGDRVTSP